LHQIRTSFGADTFDPREAERFWEAYANYTIDKAQQIVKALLGWYLAQVLPRTKREEYLRELDRIASIFPATPLPPGTRPAVSGSVRQWAERYLPIATYTRTPPRIRVLPPDPAEVGRLFGNDLWKQMLVAPIAAAFRERGVSPGNTFTVIEAFATRVPQPGAQSKPYPLEPYLTPGWLRLFAGLLDPLHRDESEPLIQSGLGVVAHGLASLPFEEREHLLGLLRSYIAQPLTTSSDRNEYATQWVDRLRKEVECVIIASATPEREPDVSPPPSPPPAPPVSAPILTPSLPVHPPPLPAQPDEVPTNDPDPVQPPPLPPPVPAKQPAALTPGLSGVSGVAPGRPVMTTITPELAADFVTVPVATALSVVREMSVAGIREWLANPSNARAFLFDDWRSESPEVAVVSDPAAVPKSLWIVGDLHADLLTLVNIIAYADKVAAEENEPPAFVFLGDFVDRGRHDHELLLLLFLLIMRDPPRVCILPGNHDIDLQWGEKQNKFGVTISPAEYCEDLNRMLQGEVPLAPDRIEMAKLLIEFCKTRPKAVILPDGTMLSHAGFPHTDLHDSLRGVADLSAKKCVEDFLWARLSESPKKRPNRLGGRGHEFGWRDFAQFCRIMADTIQVPVRQLIRGHDHIPARWQFPAEYAEFPVLTINAMGRRLDAEPLTSDGPHPFPVIARHVPDSLPRLIRLPLDPDEVERAFGKEKLTPPSEAPPANTAPPAAQANLDLGMMATGETVGVPIDFFPGGVPVDVTPPPPDNPTRPDDGDTGGDV
jgi:hypothetical protein